MSPQSFNDAGMSPEATLSLRWMRDLELLALKYDAHDILADLPYLTWGECWKLYRQLSERDSRHGT
jgi:hypothetical protein